MSEQSLKSIARTALYNPLTGKFALPELNGGLPVNVQDQTSQLFDYLFEQTTNITALSTGASKGDKVITVDSVTGFTAGKEVIILSDTVIIVNQVGDPSGNDITIDTPFPYDVAAGSPVFTALTNMAVNGSATPQSFKIGPVGDTPVDITNISGVIQDNAAMDGGTFGGITALTNGVVFRVYDASEEIFVPIWNAKTNGRLSLLCKGNTAYDDKAPAGQYQFNFVYELGGQVNHGVTIRLESGDYLEILIQDDLSTLIAFYMLCIGHLATD